MYCSTLYSIIRERRGVIVYSVHTGSVLLYRCGAMNSTRLHAPTLARLLHTIQLLLQYNDTRWPERNDLLSYRFEHIDSLCTKLSSITFAFRLLVSVVDEEVILQIYYSYVYSRWKYAMYWILGLIWRDFRVFITQERNVKPSIRACVRRMRGYNLDTVKKE